MAAVAARRTAALPTGARTAGAAAAWAGLPTLAPHGSALGSCCSSVVDHAALPDVQYSLITILEGPRGSVSLGQSASSLLPRAVLAINVQPTGPGLQGLGAAPP